jgi:magnesium transporter
MSLQDLILAPPKMKLHEIMDRDVIHVSVNVHLDTLTQMIVKYNLFAIPVVDAKMVLLGIVLMKDVLYNLHKSGKKELRKGKSKWR